MVCFSFHLVSSKSRNLEAVAKDLTKPRSGSAYVTKEFKTAVYIPIGMEK